MSRPPLVSDSLYLTPLQVAVNGDPEPDMSRLASYVEQADALLGVLSVQETIRFAARLR